MNTKVEKTPRSAQTREKTVRKKHWQRPSSLDTPPAPEGFKFRWIRESVRGYEDNKNVIGRIREGFELVRADEFPDFDFPTDSKSHPGVVSVGGLLLAKVPVEIVQERNDYYNSLAKDQQKAVDNDLMKDQGHHSMRIQNPERQTRVTFGGSEKE